MPRELKLNTRDDVNGNAIVLELWIPRELIVEVDRRAFADMVYDLMIAPLDLLADPLLNNVRELRPAAPVQLPEYANIPPHWRVLWCPECHYSVTFDDEIANSYGQEFDEFLVEACHHEH